MTLRAHLPDAYPTAAAPLVVLEGRDISPPLTQWALTQLEELFAPGESVLYAWVEAVREHLDEVLDSDGDGEGAAEALAAVAAAEAQEQVRHPAMMPVQARVKGNMQTSR